MSSPEATRRHFIAKCLGLGLGSTLLPGLLWGKMEETGAESMRELPTLTLFKINMNLEMEKGTDALASTV